MSADRDTSSSGVAPAEEKTKVYRSTRTGRIVSQAERIAAARTRVVADERRGVETEPWIVELARQSA